VNFFTNYKVTDSQSCESKELSAVECTNV